MGHSEPAAQADRRRGPAQWGRIGGGAVEEGVCVGGGGLVGKVEPQNLYVCGDWSLTLQVI